LADRQRASCWRRTTEEILGTPDRFRVS
jgi:hypothetical protein